MCSSNGVQLNQCLVRRQGFIVNFRQTTFFERQRDTFCLVRCIFRINSHCPDLFGRLLPWIFQLTTFVGYVPCVCITAVDFGRRSSRFDITFCQVRQQVFTGNHVPLTPWRDNVQIRCQRSKGAFETHLVVTFTGTTVTQRICANFTGNFYLCFCNHRAGHRGTQQVFTFVNSTGSDSRINVFADELFFQINDMTFTGTGSDSFFFQANQFFITLTDISGKCHNFTVIVFFQPWNDGRGI